ncbi:dihydropteroate synthase [Halieaceae bacterium IMCC14734]|uniref:dihydropteroate synthase n=1 Tax=Candidatus Litorirhabdus singularis TaxID=2518993 RepID=A0ABT3TP06_9GAMM|nr:dihydropteroate synthase [Candidatus Litorirhabdus singularis]MCX2983042.1 dihydropteroate synthase [Candidatus Litorirhabdus singularis]
MGVLNTTPDSFSDGGTLYTGGRLDLELTLQRARQMVADGATILDVGGESTRPGAAPVSIQQEQDRVFPVVETIAAELDVTISVDTSTPQIMTGAVAIGASVINDVRALQRPGALAAAAATDATICLMHMQGEPGSMQQSPVYVDVVDDVVEFLRQRAAACIAAGIAVERLWLDPGFGFGKTVIHNLKLLDNLLTLSELGFPVLVGLSRKSLIGKLLGREVDERLPASLALAVLAVERGATIVRTHDVRATADALAMVAALEQLDT